MLKFDVQMQLERVGEAHEKWNKARREFNQSVEKTTTRLFHEAAANYMSADEIARAIGWPVKRVRAYLRAVGLNPKQGKMVLAKTAADALQSNADLLGVHPSEVDLMSPLAYLPAGEELRQAITDASVHTVTELEPFGDDEVDAAVSRNLMDKDALADTIQDAMIGHCGPGGYRAIAQAVLDAGWHK